MQKRKLGDVLMSNVPSVALNNAGRCLFWGLTFFRSMILKNAKEVSMLRCKRAIV